MYPPPGCPGWGGVGRIEEPPTELRGLRAGLVSDRVLGTGGVVRYNQKKKLINQTKMATRECCMFTYCRDNGWV